MTDRHDRAVVLSERGGGADAGGFVGNLMDVSMAAQQCPPDKS